MHSKMRSLSIAKYSSSLLDPLTPYSINRFHCDTIIYGLLLVIHSPLPQRDKYDIIKDLLTIVYDAKPLYRNHMNQTRLGYDANLTHPQTVKYLRELVELGLLVLTDFKPYGYYEITKKGRRCLRLFGELEDDLRPLTYP
jgi:predicted transcriptional regulator